MTAALGPLSRRQAMSCLALALLPAMAGAQSAAFDHGHGAWTALLRKHVVLLQGAQASQLRYAGMAADRGALKSYLAQLSAVPEASFASFSKAQQMAFLINAYNAFTVELILGRYPRLESIRDLGSFLSKPWSIRNVPLLGRTMTLDEIEHDTLRARGRYDDPRIHFAVNCASVGCPMLREEAFVAERLDAQLEEQANRFMADRSRNRFAGGKLEVSRIFDWYGKDFAQGHQGIGSLAAFMARHADRLADAPADRERIRSQAVPLVFLDYDWKLNDAR
ncbi:MAG TPA: DUF547 domain-containing protein [Rubrivivax sp.]|nr:DUF547 domain-containing protein [Rubrivivax sp.]